MKPVSGGSVLLLLFIPRTIQLRPFPGTSIRLTAWYPVFPLSTTTGGESSGRGNGERGRNGRGGAAGFVREHCYGTMGKCDPSETPCSVRSLTYLCTRMLERRMTGLNFIWPVYTASVTCHVLSLAIGVDGHKSARVDIQRQ